jgi:hypothetical protein
LIQNLTGSRRAHHKRNVGTTFQWTSQQEESVAFKGIHKGPVGIPSLLSLQWKRIQPGSTMRGDDGKQSQALNESGCYPFASTDP